MNELFPLPDELKCDSALNMLPELMDGDLSSEQHARLEGHLKTCPECAEAHANLTDIDRTLTDRVHRLGQHSLPALDARARLEVRLAAVSTSRRANWWMAAAAAMIAAAVAFTVITSRQRIPARKSEPAPLIAIPYLPPLDTRETTIVVRIKVRIATLMAMGYTIAADPDKVVPADVLVGEDGRAHAFRVLSETKSDGKGE